MRPGVLVTLRRQSIKEGLETISAASGATRVASVSDYSDFAAAARERTDREVLLLEKSGVAVVDVDENQASALHAAANGVILSVDPEPIFVAFDLGPALEEANRLDYLRGFRDAVNHVCDMICDEGPRPVRSAVAAAAAHQDTNAFTWGLIATGVDQSPLTGKGVKVAVLDTGIDLDHPDFAGRELVTKSFIPGQSVQDANGHGTHCAGTACGPRDPEYGRGYGVAYEADLYIGKVLSDQGSSLGRSTLAGLEWAVNQGVDIISLSLGGRVAVGQGAHPAFENAGASAIEKGVLLIAAAGNDSRRAAGEIEPVGSPANCSSFMAIAAIDRHEAVADFSNGAQNPNGGKIDLAGPGVGVYSSTPDPAPPRQPPFFRQWSPRYDSIGGTSMATPHAAGIAALLKEANPNANPQRLRQLLIEMAKELSPPARDVGSGLVQAPQASPPNGSAGVRVFG